jgi:drug/metabolite transporter (DMT)-like permease
LQPTSGTVASNLLSCNILKIQPVSSEPETPSAQVEFSTKRVWFLDPYLQIGVSVFLNAAAQIFIKIGAVQVAGQSVPAISSLTSGAMWLGIVAMVLALVSWLYALRSVPLTIAFTLAAGTQVLVPLGCWIFLGEQISIIRWAGIFLVTFGILLVAQPLSKVEERL